MGLAAWTVLVQQQNKYIISARWRSLGSYSRYITSCLRGGERSTSARWQRIGRMVVGLS